MIKLAVGMVVGALVFGLSVAGCGGGGEASLTKAQFVKRGNIICAKAEGARMAVVKKAVEGLPPGGKVTHALEEKIIPPGFKSYGKAATELEELGTPEGDEGQVQKITAAMKQAYRKAEENPKLVVKESSKVFGEADELVTEYGLTKCVS